MVPQNFISPTHRPRRVKELSVGQAVLQPIQPKVFRILPRYAGILTCRTDEKYRSPFHKELTFAAHYKGTELCTFEWSVLEFEDIQREAGKLHHLVMQSDP